MTRDEAMYLLNNLRSVAEGKEDKAIDMAIEALSRPTGGDLISRADAIEQIANDNVVGGMDRLNEYRNSNEHSDYLDGISTAIATVNDIPSARPTDIANAYTNGYVEGAVNEALKRPAGEWIDVNGDGTGWKCNQCGNISCCSDNFCPNCGAQMLKGGENDV